MLRDATNLSDGDVLEANVCIVGAGAAGITLARELSDSGLQVLLLEGGSDGGDESHQDLYDGESTGVHSLNVRGCRTRSWGGSTNCWVGWCRPLEPIAFESRDWLARSGWPIAFDDVLPYYRRAAETVRIGAFEWNADAVMDDLEAPLLPFEPPARDALYRYSPPVRFGDAYRDEIDDAEDTEVYLHANVVHIGLTPNGEAVDHLECETLEGTAFTAEADAYVLAMGGLENPRMMLASNDVKPDGVGNDHDHVGRYFMEHPHFYGGAVMATRPDVEIGAYLGKSTVTTTGENDTEARQVEVRPALSVAESYRREHELLGLAATVRSVDVAGKDDRSGKLSASAIADTLLEHGEGSDISPLDPEHHRLFVLDIRAEQQPLAESRVTLTDETDALGTPRLKVDWQVSEGTLRSVFGNIQALGSAVGRLGIGRMWMPTDDDGQYRPLGFRGGCHHMGTTRMSERPEDGVVDENCKVHGVDDLYVAGSSVFPTSGYANPTLTIVALAHRLADHLESAMA